MFDFLLEIRRSSATRTIWVDALCISQEDLNEKASQVAIIGDIFAKAKTVLVWLGQDRENSLLVFSRTSDQLLDTLTTIVVKNSERDRRIARAWVDLLAGDYWTRTWIVQEVILARSILVHCGSACMDWDDLVKRCMNPTLWDLVYNQRHVTKYSMGNITSSDGSSRETHVENWISRIHSLNEQRQERIRSGRTSTARLASNRNTGLDGEELLDHSQTNILDLIIEFQDTHCTDPRDKVYALHSLEPAPSFTPNYEISRARLFINLCAGRAKLVAYEFKHLTTALNLNNLAGYRDILTTLLHGSSLTKPMLQSIIEGVRKSLLSEEHKLHYSSGKLADLKPIMESDEYAAASQKGVEVKIRFMLKWINGQLRSQKQLH